VQAPENDEPAPALAASEGTFSVRASRARSEIERALKRDSDHLWEILDQIDKVKSLEAKGDPNFVASQQDLADLANFQARKAETLQELTAAERRTYAAIADRWRDFDELNTKVLEHYGGKGPDWWRSALSCANCPSKEEAENALK